MKYRLRNRIDQTALEKNLPALSEALQWACERQFEDSDYITFVVCGFDVSIPKDRVETYGEYDPKVWNNYPEVEPPEPGLYRLRILCGEYFTNFYNYAAIFRNGEWCDSNTGKAISCDPKNDIITFTSWDIVE